MSLTSQQAGAVRAAGSVAVTAGAGTGKTHMLTERYLHHLTAHGLRPLQIVAATFTERAAAELRGRIRSRLRAEPEVAALAAELEAAQIGTLHSLAGRICREHPDEAGVPYGFALQDEIEGRLWFDRHFRAALAALPPRLLRGIGFDTLASALRALLADPFTAELALAADPKRWTELIEEERCRIFERISGRVSWRQALEVLERHAGPAEDKMELQRRSALAAIADFAGGGFTAQACAALDSLHGGRGSKSAWDAHELALLKEACVTVKAAYREGKYAFTMSLGEDDDALRSALPDLREAFEQVREYLAALKRSERILDFNDLELHALQALESSQVAAFYHSRWKAFLIDEFQDTNPVQAELLARLTPDRGSRSALLTVVGDEKQSIYGFRRADLTVFRDVRKGIGAGGGKVVELSTSFRTHQRLMSIINDVVQPPLAELHQSLEGARAAEPGSGPFLSVHLVTGGPGLKQFRQRAEAHLVGELIEDLLNGSTPVHDKKSGELRPARPGDIAILARTWNTLGPYGDDLAARGVPIIHAGGGSLLVQREATDAASLLRFLADATDELALAAVLRSPFFAVPDRELLLLAKEARRRETSWWQAMTERSNEGGSPPGSVDLATEILSRLVRERGELPPSELLTLADQLTGYTAVISNLPGGPRRLADWRGFLEFTRTLEQGHGDVFTVVRELAALARIAETKVARPGMEAGDAVSLMSVHNAKGLEWPIVILPDITARPYSGGSAVLFEADAGVALRLSDAEGQPLEPALFTLLDARRKQKEADEDVRVLYVALTRARDRVIITGSDEQGGRLDSLAEGLEAAGLAPELVPFEPANAVPKTPRAQEAAVKSDRLLGGVGPGIVELPVTSLSTYRICPKRFDFEHRSQHPGAGDGSRSARRVGVLTHLALERDIVKPDALARFDPTLGRDHVERALSLADAFRRDEGYRPVRPLIRDREQQVTLELAGVQLRGVADAVGEEFVLDYKTGDPGEDDAHLLQVAVYAHALGRQRAHVAYLSQRTLVSYGTRELERGLETAQVLIRGISAGDFGATPSVNKCGSCAFEAICSESALR